MENGLCNLEILKTQVLSESDSETENRGKQFNDIQIRQSYINQIICEN